MSIVSQEDIKAKIDNKTKPVGALGKLEKLAERICSIQNTLEPELVNPHIFVFAGDHGIANDGVCAYPQEVTHQMVLNFLTGGAAINVFAEQNNINLKIVDAGVNHDFNNIEGLINKKLAFGTKSFLTEKAMTLNQYEEAIKIGKEIIESISETNCNVVGFGEMGISNTSAAAVLMHKFTNTSIDDSTGRGAGLDNDALNKKISILKQAISNNPTTDDPKDIISTFGGFEIVMMIGAMLKAAEKKMIILVDGFIATAAFLSATKLNSNIISNAVFCHKSDEKGHKIMLKYLKADPLLKLEMRLGEGTGCAIAYPILKSAVNFINNMASFESAGVSKD